MKAALAAGEVVQLESANTNRGRNGRESCRR